MRVKLRTLLLVAAAVVVALVVGLAIFVATFDAERFRPEIVAAAKRATGRELTLGGRLGLGLFPPRVEVEDVAFANAPWGTRPQMATIERFALELVLRPLVFERRLAVRSVELSGVDLLLETDAEGHGNWVLAPESPAPAEPTPEAEPEAETPSAPVLPEIDSIALEAIALTWRDGKTGAVTQAGLDHFSLERGGAGTKLDLAARFRDTALTLAGETGPLHALDGSAGAWPIDLVAKAAGAQLSVKGTIDRPRELQGVDLRVDASGASLADLSPLAGVALPGTKDWSVGGRVTHGSDEVWSVLDFVTKVGPSNLSGTAKLALGGARPKLEAKLVSSLFATQDLLGGEWGDPGKTAVPAAPAAPAAVSPRGDRLFSDAPLPYDALARIDADVALEIARLQPGSATLGDVATTLTLADGALDLSLTKATLAGGSLTADVDLLSSKRTLSAKLQASAVNVGTLTSEMGISRIVSDGVTRMDADVQGAGASLHDVMSSLTGRFNMDMGPAVLAASAQDLARTELVRALLRGLIGGEQTRIECLVGRFDVSKGVARTRVLLAKTNQVDALGDGAIDLGRESIELYVIPRRGVVSKGVNVEVSVPLRVSGRLTAPKVSPSPIGTLQGTVGSVVPSLVKDKESPLALLLGDAGSTPSLDCAQARAIAAGQAPPWQGSSLRDSLSPLEKPFEDLKEGLKKLFR
jgi:uncharacterized protein involved in outer membrane biogenesis